MICSHRFGHMVARCCKILQVPKHQKANSSYINDVNDVMNLWCKRAIFPTLAALEGGLSYPCIVFGTRVTCIPGIRNGTILWPQIFTWSAVARSKFPPFPCTLHGRQTFQQSWWVCQRSCPQFLSWPRRRGGEEEDTLHSFFVLKTSSFVIFFNFYNNVCWFPIHNPKHQWKYETALRSCDGSSLF